MDNVISNIGRDILIKALWFKRIAAIKKYYIYAQNIRQDYRWLMMFIVARFPFGRLLGTFFYRDRHTVKQETYSITALDEINQLKSIFKDVDSTIAVESIKENGYCLGLQLPNSILKDILEYAYIANISIDGNPGFNFKYAAKERAAKQYNCEILIGNYLAVNSECLAMQKLVNDPKLREIATKYLGKEPILVRSQMGWTFVGSKKAYAKKGEIGSPTSLFHYDLDDYRALKFFFYLTDVDSYSGSHRCVLGSHKKRKLIHYILRSQSDCEIAKYYGLENIINICGSAGCGFAEDPFCFHRGSPPVNAPRLMIQLEFALNDYGMWQL
jgi:hypothetical protein